MKQTIIKIREQYDELDQYFQENQVKKILLVCGEFIKQLKIVEYFKHLEQRLGIKVIQFSEFKPNPLYESVVKGVEKFHKENCDMIIAVGGGSAIDVAKCIKLYSNMDTSINYLQQKIVSNSIKLLALPTTAGTGSEATRFAVIYYGGEKQSISDLSLIHI